MFKRARKTSEIQTVESTIGELLNLINQWTDPCGMVYSLKHKVEKQSKCFFLHVGKFDELDVANVTRQLVTRKMTNTEYSVVSVKFELDRRNIVIHVRRALDRTMRDMVDRHNRNTTGGANLVDGTKKRKRGDSSAVPGVFDEEEDSDGERMIKIINTNPEQNSRVDSIIRNVDEDDMDIMTHIIATLLRHDTSDVEIMSSKQASYEICVTFPNDSVDTHILTNINNECKAISDMRVSFEEKCLVISVPKCSSHI